MPDDLTPTGTTEDPTGTTAQAADGSGDPAAGGSAQDSVATLRQQLADLERKNAQLLSEKSAVEREREEVARARQNATDQSRGAPDPYAHLIPHVQALREAAQYDTPEGVVARSTLALMEAQEVAANQRATQIMAEQHFARMKTDEEKGAREYWATGDYRTPEAARKAWRGDHVEEIAIERERAAVDKERKAIENGRTTPNLSPRGVSATVVAARVGGTQYLEKLRAATTDAERAAVMKQHGDQADLTDLVG